VIFCALGVVRGSGLSKASAKLNFCGPTPLDFYQIVRILCRFTWEGSIGGPQQGPASRSATGVPRRFARESVSGRGRLGPGQRFGRGSFVSFGLLWSGIAADESFGLAGMTGRQRTGVGGCWSRRVLESAGAGVGGCWSRRVLKSASAEVGEC